MVRLNYIIKRDVRIIFVEIRCFWIDVKKLIVLMFGLGKILFMKDFLVIFYVRLGNKGRSKYKIIGWNYLFLYDMKDVLNIEVM